MVKIPEKYISEEGIPPRKIIGNLLASLGMRGFCDFEANTKKWEAGLEGALLFAQGKKMKLNFRNLNAVQFYECANRMGILSSMQEENEVRYRTKFDNQEDVADYLEGLDKKERAFYTEMAKAFLKRFGNPGKRRKVSFGHPDA